MLIVLGVVMHYIYPWTNESLLVAIFVPVNESVWEHLKLGYWSLIIYSIVEYTVVGRDMNNYLPAKGLGISILTLTILVIFYSYTGILGTNILAIDIGSYVLGAFLCQIISYRLFTSKPVGRGMYLFFTLILLVFGLCLAIWTFNPPHFPIFMDQNTGQFGID